MNGASAAGEYAYDADTRMDEMVNDFAFRVEQQGLRLEDYLKYMGQTVDQFLSLIHICLLPDHLPGSGSSCAGTV